MGLTPKHGRRSLDLTGGAAALAPAGGPHDLLDALPANVIQLHLLPALDQADKRALRAVSRHARDLVNASVTRVRLAAGDLLPPDAPGASAPALGGRFPRLTAVEAYDCADAPVTDDALIGFLEGCSPELLSRVTEFNIKRCHYVGRDLLAFLRARCPGLSSLAASRWTDNVSAQAVGRLSGLTHLDLSESDALDDAGLLALTALPVLRVLSLQRCRWVGDAGCRTLAQIPSLEDLNLSATDVGPAGLAELAALPRLRSLDASGCRRLDDSALAAVSGAAALASLALRNTEVHSEGLRHLGKLGGLERLDMGSRFELDDAGVAALAECRALRALTVGSFNLSRAPPPGFGAALERLSFGGGFANKGLDLLFPLPRLRSLHASGIDTVTDRVMRTVSSQTSLEELSLRSGYSLTQDGLMWLQRLANLSALSVSSCPAISDSVIARFQGERARSLTAAHAADLAAAVAAAAAAAPVAVA